MAALLGRAAAVVVDQVLLSLAGRPAAMEATAACTALVVLVQAEERPQQVA